MESILLASFIAGFLTVLAPCILPFLPIVIGGSFTGKRRSPYVVIASLLLSIIIFTFIIEGLTSLFYIPQETWHIISGTLVLLVGLTFLFPGFWARLPIIKRLSITSNRAMSAGGNRQGVVGDIVIGAALGPAFSACSPTYLIILAAILPATPLLGLLYLGMYVLGLGVVLLFIALLGQSVIEKLTIVANENGWFKRGMGILLILIAIVILTGFDETISIFLLDTGLYDFSQLELSIDQQE